MHQRRVDRWDLYQDVSLSICAIFSWYNESEKQNEESSLVPVESNVRVRDDENKKG